LVESNQGQSSVILLSDGRIAAIWTTMDAGIDSDPGGISLRIGTPQSDGTIVWADEIAANENFIGHQTRADIVGLADGRILVTWESSLGDADEHGIRGRIGSANPDGSVS